MVKWTDIYSIARMLMKKVKNDAVARFEHAMCVVIKLLLTKRENIFIWHSSENG